MKALLLFLLIGVTLQSCREKKPEEIEVLTLMDTDSSWDGNLLPKYPAGQPKIKILKYTVPPKTKLAPHEHHVINAGVLLKGELTVVDQKGNELHLKAGDPIVELVHTVHYGMNKSTEPAEIVVFYAGADDIPITVKQQK